MRVYLIVLVLLAGCATPEQKAERMIDRYGPVCDRLGYERDTNAWRDCVVAQAPKKSRGAVVNYPLR